MTKGPKPKTFSHQDDLFKASEKLKNSEMKIARNETKRRLKANLKEKQKILRESEKREKKVIRDAEISTQ